MPQYASHMFIPKTNGRTKAKIENEKKIHREEIRRGIKKVLAWYLDNIQEYPEETRPKYVRRNE